MKRLNGKTAIVTGGGRGIGLETCKRFANEGANVIVADLLVEEGEHAAAEIRKSEGNAVFEKLDVSDERSWGALIDRTLSSFGALNVLVNNAGIARIEDVETETLEGFNRLIAVNETGTWLGMKSAASGMRQTGGGSIVNVCSTSGTVYGNESSIAHHAAKGAVRMMTKNAALFFAKFNIRVNSVHPGFIDTPMVDPFSKGEQADWRNRRDNILSMTPMGRVGKADEVAAAIAFLASNDASYVTGSELYVDGGWTASSVG